MNNEKNEGLLPPGEEELITYEEAEDLISIAQRRVLIIPKLIEMSLKQTTERDWIDQSGNPYLVHSGAEKVARLFGIKLTDIKTEKFIAEDTKGKYYIYKTTGTAALPGKHDSIEAVGTCSQRDKFWAFSKKEWKDTIEIDETNILKASYTNFVVNSITHLLGLRNITWEMLANAGIKRSGIQKVEYGKGSQKAEATLTEKDIDTRKKLWDICINMSAGEEEEAKFLLKRFTTFPKDGKELFRDDIKKLTSSKWINSAYGRAKKAQQEANAAIPEEEQGNLGEQP